MSASDSIEYSKDDHLFYIHMICITTSLLMISSQHEQLIRLYRSIFIQTPSTPNNMRNVNNHPNKQNKNLDVGRICSKGKL